MTREQAINYLFSCGFTNEQVGEVVRALTYEPTTKNNLAGDIMDFPKTFDEFANFYGFKDKDEVYTNGSELIPVFRVKQWLEQISTTKNDLGVDCIDKSTKCKHKCIDNNLGVDCISRDQALEAIDTWDKFGYSARYGLERLDKDDKGYVPYVHYEDIVNCIKNLPSVTPQLSVPEVTALAEWIEKLTKECEEAYNKGYADGVKSVNICPHCGEYIGAESEE